MSNYPYCGSEAREELMNAMSVPACMSQEEFFAAMNSIPENLKACPVCGKNPRITICVTKGIISSLVICENCHCNALDKKKELKGWLKTVQEAVDDWNNLKGDKSL